MVAVTGVHPATRAMCHSDAMATSGVLGLLLAAGEGRRAGGPKALRRDVAGVPWVVRAAQVLLDGGCDHVLVVLGAAALDVESHLRDRDEVTTTWCPEWSEGMGASLRTGLRWALDAVGDEDGPDVDAALVHLVDLPDVEADVVARVLAPGHGPDTLRRAAFAGVPGHPVLLGSEHWHPVIESASGDRGARAFLAARDVVLVECGDLASGVDADLPPPRHAATSSAERPTGGR
jgi:CTP:molybdopterin cytidylyltransferase MocA